MNRIYWIHSQEFNYTKGPYTLKEAIKIKEYHDNFEEAILVLKTVIDSNGKEVK